jgi:DNA-binding NarL/FixJ family response regulator
MSNSVDTGVISAALVLEDQPDTRAWLKRVLTSAFADVSILEAGTIADARALLAEHRVDLALLDLDLPDGSGVSIIEELSVRSPQTRSVVATIYDDDEHVFPALRAGASGYLLKEQSQDVLVAMLKRIVGGEPPLSPAIARRVLRFFTPPSVPEQKTEQFADQHLSPREQEVLQLIAKGYKLAEVGELLKVSRNTAAGYLKSVYRKLNISSRAEATLEAARRGLVESK